MHSGYTQDVN